jgi:hypothetical protein
VDDNTGGIDLRRPFDHLAAAVVLIGTLLAPRSDALAQTAASPQPPAVQTQLPSPTAPKLPAPPAATSTPILASPSATPQPVPSAAPPVQTNTAPAPVSTPPADLARSPVVQCTCTSPKDDGHWTGKDLAALITGLGGLLGVGVATFAIRSNGRTSRQTTIQKANEAELESLQSKLDNFYGPYLQLSSTNRLIATDLKSHHTTTGQMRILLLLVDPDWKQNFTPGDIAFVEEILSIDAKLLDLIQEKSGLVSSAVQPYLWRAASHFRIMKLASEGKLDSDPARYAHYVYPRQLDKIIEMEINRIHGRIDLLRNDPMVQHPPADELRIPDNLKLSDWPGSYGS